LKRNLLQRLELKLPPPLLAGLTGGAMWLTARQLPALAVDVDWPGQQAIAVALALSGVLIDLAGAVAFYRARTTINPLTPGQSAAVVTRGIYRFSRNPMYLGVLLILGGWAIFLAHPLACLGLPLFVAIVTRLQIQPEERILGEKFGAHYAAYAARVRRWL
jgi:protein-S-isoprenylcysteine O-methyltransferase Ste14